MIRSTPLRVFSSSAIAISSGGALLEDAADGDVEALGVLAEDDEVDVLRRLPLERREPLVEESRGALVHVEIELEAHPEQDVARVLVAGHARVAERADEDRVEVAAEALHLGGGDRDRPS